VEAVNLFRRAPLHAHDHRPTAITVQGGGLLAPPGQVSTVVLLRCPCGDLSTQQLAGRWTLAQVRGETTAETPAIVSEPAEREEIAS
jgi:hypothetical protein